MTLSRIGVAVALLCAAGCFSHMPPAGHAHMKIHWASSYEAAAVQARATGRPLLVLLIAGKIDGLC